MQYKRIPKTNLDVSSVCMGTMTFGSPVGEAEAVRLVREAMDLGINFFDTANMYEGYKREPGSSGGVGEELLGKGVAGVRSRVILATKLGMKVGNGREDEFTSPAAIDKHLKLSLSRLGTDYIDIYYLHKPDPVTPAEEIIYALDRKMKEGLIRCYGVSNYGAEELSALLEAADRNSLPRPVICQPPLSLLKQDALEKLIPLCAREQIAVAPYQVLQGGLLTGKYKKDAPLPPDSRKAEKAGWVWELDDVLMDRIEAIREAAEQKNVSMTQYAIRWILEQPAVVSAIIGVKKSSQLEEAAQTV
jgi:aryl-alcohol dehydrogenase-like predicted oxidoreductase